MRFNPRHGASSRGLLSSRSISTRSPVTGAGPCPVRLNVEWTPPVVRARKPPPYRRATQHLIAASRGRLHPGQDLTRVLWIHPPRVLALRLAREPCAHVPGNLG